MAMTGKCTDSTNQQIIEEMIGSAPELVLNLDNQIAQIIERKEKVAEQIEVLEKCIEDYLTNKLMAILYGKAYEWTDSTKETAGLKPKYDRCAGEWLEGETYSYNPAKTFYNFVSVTDENSPFNWLYYRCIQTNIGFDDNKPPNAEYWLPITIEVYPPYSPVDSDYWVDVGGSYGAKTYGNTLKSNWTIMASDTIDPATGLPRPIPEYQLAYAYEAGPYWNTDPKVDTQVKQIVEQWDVTNDMVTKPMSEPLDPVASASYGLKAIRDALEKAQTYLTNNKNKIITMVPILGNFVK